MEKNIKNIFQIMRKYLNNDENILIIKGFNCTFLFNKPALIIKLHLMRFITFND